MFLSPSSVAVFFFFFFFNDTATTEIYTLSLHDALPISSVSWRRTDRRCWSGCRANRCWAHSRSEEHTSELQSPCNLVCRLLLEKKKIHPFRTQPSRGSPRPRQPLLKISDELSVLSTPGV